MAQPKIRKSSTAPATLPEHLLNFGPLYPRDQEFPDFFMQKKNEAWAHVLANTPGDRESAENSYFQALGGIDDIQEDYDGELHGQEHPRVFLESMIKDGCFFLQLVILILGGSGLLNYGDHTLIFGRDGEKNDRWIRSMLFSGNQISYKVLHKLMRQDFFKNIIKSLKLERPTSLFKMALYELLLFGLIDENSGGFWNKLKRRSVLQRLKKRQKPFDLIHHLQLLILGEKIEAAEDGNDGHHVVVDVVEDFSIGNVGKLRDKGLRFEKEDNIGSGGIHFGRKWFFQALYLPKFMVDEYTELILRCLVDYEKVQEKKEVMSYIKLMSELVTEASDARILYDQGIIDADLEFRGLLPGILSRVIEDAEAEVKGKVAAAQAAEEAAAEIEKNTVAPAEEPAAAEEAENPIAAAQAPTAAEEAENPMATAQEPANPMATAQEPTAAEEAENPAAAAREPAAAEEAENPLAAAKQMATKARAEATAAIIRFTVPSTNILKVRREIKEHYPSGWIDYLSQHKTLIAVISLIFTLLTYHQGQKSVQVVNRNAPPPF